MHSTRETGSTPFAKPSRATLTAPGRAAPPAWTRAPWDVVVIGGGNAALVAAIAASNVGARVLILERAPKHLRGGNSRHTRNLRCVSGGDILDPGTYGYEELWDDLCKVGEGPNDETLARFTVAESATLPAWMSAHGVRWQRPLTGTLHLDRTNRFFLGGGKALLNTYYRHVAASPRVEVAYDAMVEDFEFAGARCTRLVVLVDRVRHSVRAGTVICASGGFEANIDWLRRYWGTAADNYVIRGTPYNDGHILARLYDVHAARAGQERGFHAICVDARAPRFDGGIATRLDTIPFGIVVNRDGQRFYDEGEEVWPKRYATWGSHVAAQPGQLAWSLWDSKVQGLFLPPLYGAASASSIGELSRHLGLDEARLVRTVGGYNAAVVPGAFDPSTLDACQTKGLTPPKSHWAQALDAPPFFGVPIRPGITFTYMGVAVGADARIAREDGSMFDNVYAAGEIMSGNILSTGYLAGFGMTIGTVWGRHAGTKAAERVRG
jgi:tricarballylate dehydrogenase